MITRPPNESLLQGPQDLTGLDFSRRAGRPRVTLSYAQSLDGSLGTAAGRPLALSGAPALRLTHQLRAAHDAILIGVGALLADDPLLTVRLVEGRDPQPVVLDSRLRFPLQARLLQARSMRPWIAALDGAAPERQAGLQAAGARLLTLPSDASGRVCLPALLDRLGELGIGSLMVEGGAQVIASFLEQRLADQALLTVAPLFVDGLRLAQFTGFPRLPNPAYARLGDDLIVWGKLTSEAAA